MTDQNFVDKGLLKDVKYRTDAKITPDMLPLFWSLLGLRDVCVDGTDYISTLPQMLRIATKLIDKGQLPPGTSIQSFLDLMKDQVDKNKRIEFRTDISWLENRYKGLSAHLAGAAITSDQMARVVAQCYDLYDETALEELNQKLVDSSMNPETLSLENLNMSFGVRWE